MTPPPPSAAALRLAVLLELPNSATKYELVAEIVALEDRLTHAEAALHHLRAEIAELREAIR